MPSQRTFRNHYNPKSYLSGFKSLNKIYRYDIAEEILLPIHSLDNVGIERNIYTQELEDFFAENIDGKYPRARNNIIRHIHNRTYLDPLSADDLSVIISYIAYQFLRHPYFRSEHINQVNYLRNTLPYAQDPLLQPILDVLYSPQQSYETVSYEVYCNLFEIIKQKRWGIHIAPKGYTLMTNDTGTGMLTSDYSSNDQGLGFSTPNTLIFFILDKKHCLVMDEGNPILSEGIMTKPLTQEGYMTVLSAIALGAKKYTYSPSLRTHRYSLQAKADAIEYTNTHRR